jgi:hypothetical protein
MLNATMTRKTKKPPNYKLIPYEVWNMPDLDWAEKALLAHIWSFGRKGCFQSNETLAKVMFSTPRTVSRWITKLKRGKYVYWRRPRSSDRTMWAAGHPGVKNNLSLIFRGEMVLKSTVTYENEQELQPRHPRRSSWTDVAKSLRHIL